MRVVCKYCFSLILFYSQINIVAFPPHTLDLCFPDLCDHIPVYFSNLSPNQFFSLLTKLHSHRLFESPDMPVHFSALKAFFTLGIHLSSPNTHTHTRVRAQFKRQISHSLALCLNVALFISEALPDQSSHFPPQWP